MTAVHHFFNFYKNKSFCEAYLYHHFSSCSWMKYKGLHELFTLILFLQLQMAEK